MRIYGLCNYACIVAWVYYININIMHLQHCDTLTQVLVSSSSTCPDGHAQNATSHNIEGLGLLQVALTGLQPPAKICPFPGHGTIVTFVIHDQTNSYYHIIAGKFGSVVICQIGKFHCLVDFVLMEA